MKGAFFKKHKRAVIYFTVAIGLAIIASAIFYAVIGMDRGEYDESYIYDGSSLVGKWREDDYKDEFYQSYEFFADGRVECKTYNFGIELQTLDGAYTIGGNNTLVITYSGGIVNKNSFSITDGRLAILTVANDDMTEIEMVLVPFDLEYNRDNSALVGSWESTEDRNEVFTFNSDYTGTVKDDISEYKFTYSTKGDMLYTSYEFIIGIQQGVTATSYTVEGDILTLYGKSESGEITITLERRK